MPAGAHRRARARRAARAAALRARLETRLELGYEELFVLTPPRLAALVLRTRSGPALDDPLESVLSAGDRLAMLVERIDELSLQHHDFGGRPNALLGGFVRRIDRLKAELVFAARLPALGRPRCPRTTRTIPRRWSASSPTSMPPTSGCSSRRAPATTAT